jgi:hypothetical protein
MDAYRIDCFGSADGIVLRSSEDPRPFLVVGLGTVNPGMHQPVNTWPSSLGICVSGPWATTPLKVARRSSGIRATYRPTTRLSLRLRCKETHWQRPSRSLTCSVCDPIFRWPGRTRTCLSPEISANAFSMGCAGPGYRRNDRHPSPCRDPCRRCGGVFAADGGGRRRHARTPQSTATCRSRTTPAQEPAALAGGTNGLADGAENDRDQRHPD